MLQRVLLPNRVCPCVDTRHQWMGDRSMEGIPRSLVMFYEDEDIYKKEPTRGWIICSLCGRRFSMLDVHKYNFKPPQPLRYYVLQEDDKILELSMEDREVPIKSTVVIHT